MINSLIKKKKSYYYIYKWQRDNKVYLMYKII